MWKQPAQRKRRGLLYQSKCWPVKALKLTCRLSTTLCLLLRLLLLWLSLSLVLSLSSLSAPVPASTRVARLTLLDNRRVGLHCCLGRRDDWPIRLTRVRSACRCLSVSSAVPSLDLALLRWSLGVRHR